MWSRNMIQNLEKCNDQFQNLLRFEKVRLTSIAPIHGVQHDEITNQTHETE